MFLCYIESKKVRRYISSHEHEHMPEYQVTLCPSLSLGCVPGHFGPDCALTCSDCPGECDPEAGGCVCEAGRTGPTCDLTCPEGFYGVGCNEVEAGLRFVSDVCPCICSWRFFVCIVSTIYVHIHVRVCACVCVCVIARTMARAQNDAFLHI